VALVLIIDDDQGVCETISAVVRRIGHQPCCASSLRDGLEISRANIFDAVLVDVQLPDGSGLDLLPNLRQNSPSPEVIIMTGRGDPDGAELAIRNGAWDYVQKPSDLKNIELPLTRALQYQEQKKNRKIAIALVRDGIIGDSPAIKECLDQVAQAALSNANALIYGETGTGKELFAMAIHKNSLRANKNFVVVDCSALPATLVESVLFGHEKGAYTGADRAQDGLIAQADNGTLFLDEVGELPMSLQKSFLRVIQERCYRPVGGKKEIYSNFSLIAATNRNLDIMVREGQFRDDLLYRLRTIHISLPPLRKHKEDIRELTVHYTAKLCDQYKMAIKGFTPEFFDVLDEYDWPGNVRELNQALERAIASAGHNPVLYPKDLPIDIRARIARNSVTPPLFPSEEKNGFENQEHAVDSFPTLEEARSRAIAETEREYLHRLLVQTEGDLHRACAISGLSRSRLYSLLKKNAIAVSSRKKS
jgi:two-component system NtrC family response regulator